MNYYFLKACGKQSFCDSCYTFIRSLVSRSGLNSNIFLKKQSVLIQHRFCQGNPVSALNVKKSHLRSDVTDCKWKLDGKMKMCVRKLKCIYERFIFRISIFTRIKRITYAETQQVMEGVWMSRWLKGACVLPSSRTSCGSNKIVWKEIVLF